MLIPLHKSHRRFLAHSGDTGDIIRRVAHERLEIDDASRLKAVLLKKELRRVFGSCGLTHAAFDVTDMRRVAYKLEAVLITGDDAALPAAVTAFGCNRAEQVVGLKAFELKAQYSHCVKHLLEYGHLNGKLLGHRLALRLIALVSHVAERGRLEVKRYAYGLGLLIIKQLAEYRKKSVHAVCGRTVRRVEHADAIKGPVYYTVAVKYHQFHHFTSPRRRTISSLS